MLCVNASDPDGEALTVEFRGRALNTSPGEEFTIVALPDTQFYALFFPFVFDSQLQWIVENKQARNIRFVSQLGDCVHNGGNTIEWSIADRVMSRLEDPLATGQPDGIPYGIAVGNHDNSGTTGTLADQSQGTELYNTVFGRDRFEGRIYYGGHFGTNYDNHFELFSASGMDFIAMHLEWEAGSSPLREAVLAWADDLLETYPERRAIVTVHELLNIDGGWGDQGQATYDTLKHNPNLFLMLCGHLWNNPRRLDTFDGNPVHTLMSNYQHLQPFGGNGWLRIMTFKPLLDQIEVQTYSPWLDSYMVDSTEQFTLAYDMGAGVPFHLVGKLDNVPSGSAACLSWPGCQSGTQYQWRVKVSDGSSTTVGPVWGFSSNGSCNTPAECDDGDLCTADACQANVCAWTASPNCCEVDADCADGDPCTDDLCSGNTCQSVHNTGPCTDGVGCTVEDSCSFGQCVGTLLDCDDGNDCTTDECATGGCDSLYSPLPGCCSLDADCDDLDSCTEDSCAGNGDCTNAPIPNCCEADSQCSDGSACTADVCELNAAGLSLDGNGAHMSVGQMGNGLNQALNATEFTVETWFKWDGGGTTTDTAGFFEFGTGGGITAYPLITKGRALPDGIAPWHINYFLGISEPGHMLAADFEEHSSGAVPGKNHPVIGVTPVTPGVWHHAAASYDGCCWRLYLDGRPDTDGTNCPGQPANHECDQYFGLGTAQSAEGFAKGAFSGILDEARVWNRARSLEEIQAGMFEQIVMDADLLGRWGFEDAAGHVATDTTGNANLGNLVLTRWEFADLPPLAGLSCGFPTIPGCCQVDADCDDANLCTVDDCVGTSCTNVFTPSVNCCAQATHCDDGDPCTADACFHGSCDNTVVDTDGDLLPDCQDPDDDGDGTADCHDCAPLLAETATAPPEISGLVLDQHLLTVLAWDAPAMQVAFDVASGSLFASGLGTAACLLDDGGTPGHVDTRPGPQPGELFYYLVRADGACAGSWGASSSELLSLPSSPCY
jgi:hypothetical protein